MFAPIPLLFDWFICCLFFVLFFIPSECSVSISNYFTFTLYSAVFILLLLLLEGFFLCRYLSETANFQANFLSYQIEREDCRLQMEINHCRKKKLKQINGRLLINDWNSEKTEKASEI